MANKRIRSYWLVLLVMLMCVNMILSVEPSRAHYINTTVWNTVLEAEDNAVTSKQLAKVSDAPLTVLVGEIDMEGEEVTFQLDPIRNASGKLTWKADKADYLHIFMRIGDTVVEPGSEIELTAGNPVTVTMLLVPTQMARVTAQEPKTLNITVKWEDVLQGTFRVILPVFTEPVETEPVETEPVEPEPGEEPVEPESSETESSMPESTEPESSKPEPDETEPSAPENSVPENTVPQLPEQVDADAGDTIFNKEIHAAQISQTIYMRKRAALNINLTETAEEQTEPTTAPTVPQLPDPTMESTEPVLPIAEPDETEPTGTETKPTITEPTTTEPTSEPTTAPTTEPADPVSGEDVPRFALDTVGGFTPSQKLPVKLSLTDEITEVKLGMGTDLQPFPANTCYSLDQGASYYLLYHKDTITVPADVSSQCSVLLDFSRVDLAETSEIVLHAEGYADQKPVDKTSVTTAVRSAQEVPYQMDTQLMTRGSSMTIALNENWKAYEFTYSVERLATDPEEAEKTAKKPKPPEYIEVDASEWSKFLFDEENYKLMFQIDALLPTAGTYRVNLQWAYEGICFAETQATFFINYSVYSESEGTGGTEQ